MAEREGIGLDTALLQGVDSFVRRHRESRNIGDPHDDRAFVHSIDAFTDTIPVRLILPREHLGHLAPVGALLATKAATQPAAEQLAPLAHEDGVRAYAEYFGLLAKRKFLNKVVAWSWFQFFDADVLRGYGTRMDAESIYLNAAIGDDFAAAVNANPDQVRELATSMSMRRVALYPSIADMRGLQDQYRLRSPQTNTAADAMLRDIDRLSVTARALGGMDPIALLMLAYSGSVFRRGWQYGAVYERHTTVEAYLPQPLRSAFMRDTSRNATTQAPTRERVHFWSWGSLLRRAILQAPTVWSEERLCRTLQALEHARIPTSFQWDHAKPLAQAAQEAATNALTLRELAREHGIMVTTNDVVQRWESVMTWSCRVAPELALVVIEKIVERAFGTSISTATELASVGGMAAIQLQFEAPLNAFARALSQRLFTSVLRVSGEGIARKIVGLDWTNDDSVTFTAQRPRLMPTHKYT